MSSSLHTGGYQAWDSNLMAIKISKNEYIIVLLVLLIRKSEKCYHFTQPLAPLLHLPPHNLRGEKGTWDTTCLQRPIVVVVAILVARWSCPVFILAFAVAVWRKPVNNLVRYKNENKQWKKFCQWDTRRDWSRAPVVVAEFGCCGGCMHKPLCNH